MTFPKGTILILILTFLVLNSNSQALIGDYKFIIKPDYCNWDTTKSKDLIGRPIKLWSIRGVYSTLNESKMYKWPSEEIKKNSGKSGWGDYRPKVGDTGSVIHIFRNKGASTKYIYLIKIKDKYVPVGCHDLTDKDKPDSHEYSINEWIKDSIDNATYASGCKFKIQNVNGKWSRAGSARIDKVSEVFACNLISKGIDSIMLCKYLSGNGSSPIEKAFVIWLDNGKGFVKSFFNNSRHQPTENTIIAFNTKPLINYFFENRLDTVTSEPKTDYWISHSMGYSIQLYTPTSFYRHSLVDYLIRDDKNHPKAIWWNLISEQLGALKKE